MKRKLLIFVLFTAIFFTSFTAVSHAQETVMETDSLVGTDTAILQTPTASGRVDYELTYPGMLPDHPLYILKVIRDAVVKMLINDNMKRARFSLLSAEKRIYSGKMLVEKGKDGLAIETISKGNNYMNDALKAIESVKEKTPDNIDVYPFLLQYKSASQKHLEIVAELEPSIEEQLLTEFSLQQKRAEQIVKTADKLLLLK